MFPSGSKRCPPTICPPTICPPTNRAEAERQIVPGHQIVLKPAGPVLGHQIVGKANIFYETKFNIYPKNILGTKMSEHLIHSCHNRCS